MPQSASKQFSGIFVSYRRDDSSGHAGRLSDRLSAHFGNEQIFMDIDQIEPGEDFVEVIENAVGSCEILIAIIGRQWLSSVDGSSPRLNNPNDFVRLEIIAALNRDIRVIPVLVQGATMPNPQDLPDDLSKLSRRNALELSDRRWNRDVDQLIVALEKILRTREDARRAAQEEEERQQREVETRMLQEAQRREELRKREEQTAARRVEAERRQQEGERQRQREVERRKREAKDKEARRLTEERVQIHAEEKGARALGRSAFGRWWIVGGLASLLVLGIFLITMNRQRSSAFDGSLLGRPLRVGIPTRLGYAAGIIANNGFKPNKDCIFWNKYHQTIEFVLIEDVDQRSQAFVGGGPEGVDIVWATVDSWANELSSLNESGVKARAIMQVDWSRGGDAIVADASIARVEDLKGKKISLVKYMPSHWLLEYSLENSGLSDNDQKEIVDYLEGKNSTLDARQAFKDMRVDAAVVWGPDVTLALERLGSHVLVSTETANNLIADLMVAREDFIKAHPDVIKAFIQAWLDGTAEALRNPNKVGQLLIENEPVYADLKKLRYSFKTVKYADLAENTKMFGLDGGRPVFDQLFTAAGAAWIRQKYITQQTPPGQARDITFLKEIYSTAPVPRATEETSPPKSR